MTHASRSRRGFTLWEMAVVMAIIAVSAVVVVPRMWLSFGEDRPAQTGEALLSLLRDARRVAIERNQVVYVNLDPASQRFRVDTSGIAGTGMLAEGMLETGGWETLVTTLPRLRYVFRPTGAALGDSVRVRGNESVLVTVDPWSGEAMVHAR